MRVSRIEGQSRKLAGKELCIWKLCDEVWVLTRSNNKEAIEADPLGRASGLHFIYYDLPLWALKLKKHLVLLFTFVLWQWGAYRLAAKHHRNRPFDCVYHVTFVSLQAGSFMGRLEFRLLSAPSRAANGLFSIAPQYADVQVKNYSGSQEIASTLRSANPHSVSHPQERIYVATPSSLRLIPPKWHTKTNVQLILQFANKPFDSLNVSDCRIFRDLCLPDALCIGKVYILRFGHWLKSENHSRSDSYSYWKWAR